MDQRVLQYLDAQKLKDMEFRTHLSTFRLTFPPRKLYLCYAVLYVCSSYEYYITPHSYSGQLTNKYTYTYFEQD